MNKKLICIIYRNICHDCHKPHKSEEICAQCKKIVLLEERLFYRNEIWHAEHFNCTRCAVELDNEAKVFQDKLYCNGCYSMYIMKVCAQCHHLIDFLIERGKTADGKHYHINVGSFRHIEVQRLKSCIFLAFCMLQMRPSDT